MSDVNVIRQDETQAGESAGPRPRIPGLPRVALMGEFSAGKTTLINFLLGAEILPTRVTATQMPPVWMSYGPQSAYYVDMEGSRHEMDFAALATIGLDGVRYVRVVCEAEILSEFELIDTPGISDPNISDEYRKAVVEFADAVIWCTHAPQAWRESERSAWEHMPERLTRTSVLLATRSDKLNDKDRARVEQRLKREAGQGFREIIMFSTLDAVRASEMEDGHDLLVSSGAERLVQALHALSQDMVSDAAPRPTSAESGSAAAMAAPAQSTGGVVVPLQPAGVRPQRVARVGAAHRHRPPAEDAPAARVVPFETEEPASVAAEVAEVPAIEPEDAAFAEAIMAEAPTDPMVEEMTAGAADVLDLSAYLLSAEDEPAAAPRRTAASDLGLLESAREPEPMAVLDQVEETLAQTSFEVENEDFSAVLSSIGRVVREQSEARDPVVEEPEPFVAFAAEAEDEPAPFAEAIIEDEPVAAPQPVEGPLTARAIWNAILADGEVATVADVVEAIGRLVDELDRSGLMPAAAMAIDRAADRDQL